ncbi:MAG: phosphopantetheine adenylyltransferase [Methanosarcinales archaeon]|jgi:pantetheine-phosphate adenylyltransferase|nr:phosphopantetheine adenylyltransferase [Methanosarcinales archaeon]
MVRVVLGGTFESLHSGHSELIKEAFGILKEAGSGVVHIGLTSDEMAAGKNHAVSDYESRRKMLSEFISELLKEMNLPADSYLITRLDDPFGPSVSEYYDYIVVSPETRVGAEKINEIRWNSGLPELNIRVVDFVLAEDTIPISTTRIYNGEIDRRGRLQNKKSTSSEITHNDENKNS